MSLPVVKIVDVSFGLLSASLVLMLAIFRDFFFLPLLLAAMIRGYSRSAETVTTAIGVGSSKLSSFPASS